MPSALVATKLHVPRQRGGTVVRPRLADRLARGTERRLTLVSAPPGFGKTTLIADWIAQRPAGRTGVGWVSLDAADDDASSFWAYVGAALRAASGDLDLTPSDSVDLGALVNALAEVPGPIVLVLDDLHAIETARIHDELATFIDRLPEHVHVVIATRADPPLPLALLRARGELLEIRASDLRFTPDEAAAYLNASMGLRLTARDVAALEARTEGWIAALQLAALSMEGRADPAAFVATFAGDDRYVVDYLADEVLARQSEEVRRFLTETSLVDRFSAPLCDALTGRTDGRAMLDRLERGNLFLVALDDQRRWYRYHHLFADVLRARLREAAPERVPELHRRASAWFEASGDEGDAIRHALAAGDLERAADLIETVAYGMMRRRQEVTLRRWLDELPFELLERRPVLAMAHVGVLLTTGELAGVEERLAAIEPWLPAALDERERAAAVAAGMVVRDLEVLPHLPAATALHLAGLARLRGDHDEVIVQARRVLDVAPEEHALERGGAAGLLGLAYWSAGELAAAYDAWSDAVTGLTRAGNVADVLGVSIALADIRIAQGRLGDARQVFERGLRIGTEGVPSPLRGTPDMLTGLGELLLEGNDLVAARGYLARSEGLGEGLAMRQDPYRWRVAMARLRWAEGVALDGTLELLDDAERRYTGDMFPEVRPVHAVRTRVWLAQGRLADARAWARDHGLSVDDKLTFLGAYEHLTLARILVAEARTSRDAARADEAVTFTRRIRDTAERAGHVRNGLDALIVEAGAHEAAGRRSPALEALDRAVTQAEPEGEVRLFAEEGPAMAALLDALARTAPDRAFIRRLLAAFAAPADHPPARQPLIEPLSDRELEVLRTLASDLDGPAIARELFVSVNTLRTHTKNIFAKLDVNSRRAAVSRGIELGLLPGSARR